jgi:hypothetical protein
VCIHGFRGCFLLLKPSHQRDHYLSHHHNTTTPQPKLTTLTNSQINRHEKMTHSLRDDGGGVMEKMGGGWGRVELFSKGASCF